MEKTGHRLSIQTSCRSTEMCMVFWTQASTKTSQIQTQQKLSKMPHWPAWCYDEHALTQPHLIIPPPQKKPEKEARKLRDQNLVISPSSPSTLVLNLPNAFFKCKNMWKTLQISNKTNQKGINNLKYFSKTIQIAKRCSMPFFFFFK